MKVIELLNKIANGEEVPEKFKYKGETYIYRTYTFEDGDIMTGYGFEDGGWLNIWRDNLNDEVEIIEEDKKIEKYDTGLTNGRYTEDSIKTGLDTDITIENIIINMGIEITLVKEKMFEIIDKINSMEVK